MTDVMIISLWVGGVSLLLLLIFSYLLMKRRRLKKVSNIKRSKQEFNGMQQEISREYTSNERLDGARVSHRRTHPDRIFQESMWKEKKDQEEPNGNELLL